jgi:hypothetical protein
MFESIGTLQYGPGIKAIILIDQQIAEYYRTMIPKYMYAKPQMYPAHITVVRLNKESPANMQLWGKYQNNKITFCYDNTIRVDWKYYYLDAFSDQIGEIREELGLPKYRDRRTSYHITIGNIK